MIVVDILLFCIVGLCVVVFLIVDSIDEKAETFQEADDQSSLKASVDQEKQILASEHFKRTVFQEIREEKANGVDGVKECDGKGEEEMLDDWEGIERTELEQVFGEAVNFVNNNNYKGINSGDVKLQLYGLQKVALEGACRGSQPMALKFSARAKWNAWQKLGDMSREMAMEKYVNILVKAIPGWEGKKIQGQSKMPGQPEDLVNSLSA